MENHKHVVMVPITEYLDMLNAYQERERLIKNVVAHVEALKQEGIVANFNVNCEPTGIQKSFAGMTTIYQFTYKD